MVLLQPCGVFLLLPGVECSQHDTRMFPRQLILTHAMCMCVGGGGRGEGEGRARKRRGSRLSTFKSMKLQSSAFSRKSGKVFLLVTNKFFNSLESSSHPHISTRPHTHTLTHSHPHRCLSKVHWYIASSLPEPEGIIPCVCDSNQCTPLDSCV